MALFGAVVITRPGGALWEAEIQKLLPATNLYTPEVLRRDFRALLYQSTADPQLGFHVLVPKNWTERRLEKLSARKSLEDREPVLLTALSPVDRTDAVLEISYLHLAKPLSLRQLMQAQVQRLGARVLARQPGTFNNRQVEDALVRWQHPTLGPSLTRLTISREGEFLFLVASTVKEQSYVALRNTVGVAAVSFTSLATQGLARSPRPQS